MQRAARDSSTLPIYIFWQQGLENCPRIVQRCIESWRYFNEDRREVVLLDGDAALALASPETRAYAGRLGVAHFSDLLRLDLLEHSGGIWCDATLFCTMPLEQWLPSLSRCHFFAFSRPSKDKLIANWFLGAGEHSYIISALRSSLLAYWSDIHSGPRHLSFLSGFLDRHARRGVRESQLWLSPLVRTRLRQYPYFIFHYLFNHLYLSDGSFRDAWDRVPCFSAQGPHAMQSNRQFFRPLPPDFAIDQSPVYKLTYKYNQKYVYPGSAIHFFLESDEAFGAGGRRA
mgnify:CR=1 FL=1